MTDPNAYIAAWRRQHWLNIESELRAARRFLHNQEPPNVRMAVEKLLQAVTIMQHQEPLP